MTAKNEFAFPREALQRLVRQRAALIDRLERVENAIAELSSKLGAEITGEVVRRNTTRASRRRKTPNYAENIRIFAKSALFKAGHPMTRSELVQEAVYSRIPLPDGDLAQFFGRVLWRSDEFIHVGTGYWLPELVLQKMEDEADLMGN